MCFFLFFPIASIVFKAENTISGTTEIGSLWIVSPLAQAASAICINSLSEISERPMSDRVVGKPTDSQKEKISFHKLL